MEKGHDLSKVVALNEMIVSEFVAVKTQRNIEPHRRGSWRKAGLDVEKVEW